MSKTKVEITLDTLVEFAAQHKQQMKEMGDHFDHSMSKVATSLDGLTIQVVQMNTGVKRAAQAVEKLAESVERQNAAIDGHLRVAEQQASNISELSKLVAIQATTVNRLIEQSATGGTAA